MGEIIYPLESYKIMGACFKVYKEMGPGFLESVYQECLEMEFTKQNIPFSSQKELKLFYCGEELKQTYNPDFICYDKIILEIKAVSQLLDEHRAQTFNYLKATKYNLAILANFCHYPKLEYERFALTKLKNEK